MNSPYVAALNMHNNCCSYKYKCTTRLSYSSFISCHIYCRYSQQGCHIFPFLTQLEKLDCCGCKFAQQHVSAKNIKNMVFTFLTSGCKYTQQSCHIFPFLTELSQGWGGYEKTFKNKNILENHNNAAAHFWWFLIWC